MAYIVCMGLTILLQADFSKGIQVRSRHIGHISKDRSCKDSQGLLEEFRQHINKFLRLLTCMRSEWYHV